MIELMQNKVLYKLLVVTDSEYNKPECNIPETFVEVYSTTSQSFITIGHALFLFAYTFKRLHNICVWCLTLFSSSTYS